MNTFWLKIAGAGIVVLVVIIGISVFYSDKHSPPPQQKPQTQNRPKTVYDSFDRDDKKFAIKPQPEESAETTSPAQPTSPPPAAQQPAPAALPQPKFESLTLEQEVEAQRFFEMAKAERKMGRLPIMGYKKMVDYCREIIRRWPRSQYAFQAKRMLADIPERYQEMYKISKQELDTSSFYK